MRQLGSSDLLTLWERGYGLHPLDRGVLALGAAFPEMSYERLADWPLGKRNGMLAAVRCAFFGPWLTGWSACEGCGEKLELEVDGRILADGAEAEDGAGREPVMVGEQRFRLPTTRDLSRLVREADAATAGRRLAEMCRMEPGEALTEDEIEMVAERLAAADPMAEIRLEMLCPICGHEGYGTLDPVSFVWAELEVRAKRLLVEVHRLAAAYGWGEGEILALSAARRSFYLDLVQA